VTDNDSNLSIVGHVIKEAGIDDDTLAICVGIERIIEDRFDRIAAAQSRR